MCCYDFTPVSASVYDQAWREAFRHKWIESQKRGFDLGRAAIKDWDERHFKKFYRWCHWQHLTGRQFFKEFPEEHFDRVMDPRDEIEQLVIGQFWDGLENLEIFNCALGCGWPTDQVRVVLSRLQINEARLSPLVS